MCARVKKKIDGEREREEGVSVRISSKVNVDFIHFFRSALRWTCCIGASVYARPVFSLPVPW